MESGRRVAVIKFKFTEKPDIRVGDDVICETAITVCDIVLIEPAASRQVVIRTLDDKQFLSFNGKKYLVAKDKEQNAIELTLL